MGVFILVNTWETTTNQIEGVVDGSKLTLSNLGTAPLIRYGTFNFLSKIKKERCVWIKIVFFDNWRTLARFITRLINTDVQKIHFSYVPYYLMK